MLLHQPGTLITRPASMHKPFFGPQKQQSNSGPGRHTAGIESTAKTTSLISMTARASSKGVADFCPFGKVTQKLVSSYASDTLMKRLQNFQLSTVVSVFQQRQAIPKAA